MASKVSLGCAVLLVPFLVTALLSGPLPAYADGYLPLAPGQSPHLPEAHPPMLLEPSPVGGVRVARTAVTPDTVITDPLIDVKVLVILDTTTYCSGLDPYGYSDINQMITGYLDYLGIPYDIIDVGDRAPGVKTPSLFAESDLWDGVNRGYYYSIFVATSVAWWPTVDFAGLTPAERELIRSYERNFDVRRVRRSAYPEASQYGLDAAGTAALPLDTTLTTTGQEVFNYLKPDVAVPITGAGTFGTLATPVVGAVVTPLLRRLGGRQPWPYSNLTTRASIWC